MLKRKMYNSLLDWKNCKNSECLLIKGARQVGKTYLVREFGKNEYESFIEINFYSDSNLKSIFEGNLSAEEIYKRITFNIPNVSLIPGKTLIFLDEIQRCSKARTALKFLAEDGRYDVIASGSLLGLTYGWDADKEVEEVESVPVGYEHQITMYSLDFEEFLWANGFQDNVISLLREYYDNGQKVPDEVNDRYEALVREYMAVGGMPEVVADYVLNKDFNRVQTLQEKIISSYFDDISNHAKGAEKVKVKQCYDSIPRQLARENRKFKYSEVEKRATARKFGDSVLWLCHANMVNICNNIEQPYLPLKAYSKENEYKLYMNDTGLLMALMGFETKKAFLNNQLKGYAKGGIYENFAAETLVKNGYSLYYYKRDDSLELEFIIEKNGGVSPIEVKAGNTSTVSLNGFIDEYKPSVAYKLIKGNIGIAEVKCSLPHYMAMFI
ncbi:MAG: ATP-binding protein [Bacteroidaceae bacterium]|nr:ATP-binding protein [Bacteroidaceae bacterium]